MKYKIGDIIVFKKELFKNCLNTYDFEFTISATRITTNGIQEYGFYNTKNELIWITDRSFEMSKSGVRKNTIDDILN